MNNPARQLRAVTPSPESRLRAGFAREDALLEDLAQVRAEQRLARNDYAAEHGLLMRPSVESLRKVLGQ